jgi:hypothetical protein
MKLFSLAKHEFPKTVSIYRGFLPSRYCEDIIQAYKKLKKIDNTGDNQDNLFNTERTDWFAHNDPVVKDVAGQIFLAFGKGCVFDEIESNKADLNLTNSWIAESKSGAFVEPHHHGLNFYNCSWSFVFYAKIPNGISSLVFQDKICGKHEILVKEGDFLLFPSDFVHYTDDTCEGRTIYSGNFNLSLR